MLKNQEKQKEFVSNDIRALCNRSRNLVPLDQLKSKADKAGRRATMTLFGGKEKDLLKYQMLDCSKDDVSTSNEGKEFLIDDVDYYKKIIAVCVQLSLCDESQHLLNGLNLIFRYDICYRKLPRSTKQTQERL